MRHALVFGALFLAHAAVAAPGPKAAGKPAAKVAPATMPSLRTGERKLVDHPEVLKPVVSGSTVDGGEELISLNFEGKTPQPRAERVVVKSTGGGPAFALVADNMLWVRRSAKDAGRALEGELYFSGEWRSAEPTEHFRFSAAGPTKSVSDPKLRAAFADAVSQFFSDRHSGIPFYSYAAEAVRNRYLMVPKGQPRNEAPRRARGNEIERLMDTTTGMTSIQESIQADRPLWLGAASEKPTVPLASLKGPPLAQHPFAALLKALKKPVPEEKLATATPADFYYMRLNDLAVFFKIVDQLDAWATPAMNVVEGHGEDHAISERTLTQLGLERSALARSLGTSVVADLALVGSDPYIREGSDLTVIFRVKQKAFFDVALSGAIAKHLATHGVQPASSAEQGGVAIQIQRSTDGAVRQHRATVGDLEIVSNSMGAMRRVIETIGGKWARLSDEPDMKYMLARGAGERTDGFIYLGDRFISEVVGPRQKILESRRQVALAELLVPGYAALLHGWWEGRAPLSTDELLGSGWLKKDELRHVIDGSAITFSPDRGARSSWGAPSALEPMIDLPTPKFVTTEEKNAYDNFVNGYQQYWRRYMDPVAIRIGVETSGKETKLVADVRVLPLIDGTDYREISEMVGRARLTTPFLKGGIRAVLGIGADARLRRELTQFAGHSPLGGSITLDWLGDWLFFGVEDKAEAAHTLLMLEPHALPQAPGERDRDRSTRDKELEIALRTPAYLAIGIHNSVGAALFLTAAKKLANDAAPGIINWGEGTPYKGTRIVHISVASKSIDRGTPGADVFYSLTDGALVFSLSEAALQHIIDERAGDKGTQAVEKQDGSAQFVVEAASDKGAPMNTILGWIMEQGALESMERSRNRAEVFLRGAPGAALRTVSLLYEGAEPLPADGGHFALAADGVRDPARGSHLLEKWPAVPVPGSPVEKLMSALAHFRGEVGFDEEPKLDAQPAMRSLHARVTLILR